MSPRRFVLLFLSALLLAGSGAPLAAEELREQTTERYALASGGRVEIANVNGSLEFLSWDRDEVQVEATKVVKTLGHGRARRALDELRIEVEHTPRALTVRTRAPHAGSWMLGWLVGGPIHARVTYRLTLPHDVVLEATTVNGDVTLDAVRGTVDAETTNGSIRIVAGEGATKAETTNGGIRAEFVDLAPRSDVELRTTNGGIVVFVPSTTGAEIDASTVNGAVNTDFEPLDDGSSTWRRKSLRGSINGGGGQLKLETVNGSIQVRASDGV